MPPKNKLFVGVDLGGTSVRAAVVNARGQVLALEKRKTRADRGAAAVVDRLAETIERALEAAHLPPNALGGIGVGVPGPVDTAHRTVQLAVNLGPDWKNLPLAEQLETRLALPTYVDNDVRCGAMGEHTHGAGQGVADMLAIFIGTGIGGGVILNHELRLGFRGSAGEVGHTVIAADNSLIGKTGQAGTVEPLASTTGMEQQIRMRVANGAKSVVPALIESSGQGHLTSRVIYQALQKNDPVMLIVLATAQRALGLLAANLINILDPQLLVFGGGVTARLGGRFIAPIRATAYANLINKQAAREIKFVPAALKDAAGVVGAAVLARRHL